jgi:hypothetical protein
LLEKSEENNHLENVEIYGDVILKLIKKRAKFEVRVLE